MKGRHDRCPLKVLTEVVQGKNRWGCRNLPVKSMAETARTRGLHETSVLSVLHARIRLSENFGIVHLRQYNSDYPELLGRF